MKKYLFIILLVGVCFGQIKVYSEHPTDTLTIEFETQLYTDNEKKKRQLQLFAFWECINDIDCSFALDWDYLDKNGKKDLYSLSKKRIAIENISKLISGIKEISKHNFKKYDKKVTYDIGSKATNLELNKNDEYSKLISIQNDEYRGLIIADSKKIISKLENWLSQKPIKAQKASIQNTEDKEKNILLNILEYYDIELVAEFDNEKVVLINNKRFREGEYLNDDIIIQRIENDQIIFKSGKVTVTTKVGN